MKKLLKIFSVSIASLTLCASSIMPQVSAVSSNTENNKSLSQKAKDFILNHKGELGFGTAALASTVALFKILSTENVDVERYINSSGNLEVAADKWFERLGGTQEDIKKYNEDVLKISSQEEKLGKDFEQIGHDVLRTFFKEKDVQKNQKMLSNILKVWQLNNVNLKRHYIQGMNDYGEFILLKFCENHTEYAEAKAYYVFTKTMEAVYNNYIEVATDTNYMVTNNGKKIKGRITNCFSKKEKSDFYDLVNLFTNQMEFGSLFLINPILMCALRLYTYEESVKIWDQIILDDKITTKKGFNLNNFQKVMDAIIGKKILDVYSTSGVNIKKLNEDDFQKLSNLYNGK